MTRLEKDGRLSVLADRYEGKRLNSPNDLVYRSDGTLYFSDPPFGLPKFFDDPREELPFSGVFSLQNGKVQLVTTVERFRQRVQKSQLLRALRRFGRGSRLTAWLKHIARVNRLGMLGPGFISAR